MGQWGCGGGGDVHGYKNYRRIKDVGSMLEHLWDLLHLGSCHIQTNPPLRIFTY